jgi:hypothetical protein
MWAALTNAAIPPLGRWLAIGLLTAAFGTFTYIRGLEHGQHELADYIGKQAAQTVTIVKHEVQTVTKTETKYRDRIQKIHDQGEQNASRIPEVLPPDLDRRLPLPAGFVRILDAAWAGAPVGPATDSDKEPSSVPPSVVAANESDNATSCRIWREQALGWREFYADQQIAINGKAGDWYHPEPKDPQDNSSLNASIEALQGEKHD